MEPVVVRKGISPNPVDDRWQMVYHLSPNHPAEVFKSVSPDCSHNMQRLSNGTGQALFRGSYALLLLRQGTGEPALRRKHPARTKVVLQARAWERSPWELLQPLVNASSQEGVVKTRCDVCNGAFGLIRRRYRGHQFCCGRCEDSYKAQRTKFVTEVKARLYSSLATGRAQTRTNPAGEHSR